tara:strand:- start:4259 stop:4441 length:183 start_codon:yes stop_codon:yes gene_type:complete
MDSREASPIRLAVTTVSGRRSVSAERSGSSKRKRVTDVSKTIDPEVLKRGRVIFPARVME